MIKIEKRKDLKQKPDFDNLGFGKFFTDHMFVMNYDEGQGWHDPRVVPYENFSFDPATTVFHYAQEIFEGLKAFKNGEEIVLFRPEANFERMNNSCRRMCIPELDTAVHFALGSMVFSSSANALVSEAVLFIFQLPAIMVLRYLLFMIKFPLSIISCARIGVCRHGIVCCALHSMPGCQKSAGWRTLGGSAPDPQFPYVIPSPVPQSLAAPGNLGSCVLYSLSISAATPGSSLPSINSREAPPPVEMWVILSAKPIC